MKNIKNISITGVMAAMITMMILYVCHVPIGMNGGYIHFGDAFIYMSAALLPRPYALLAAAVGAGLADLIAAPMWAPATIIIKMLIVLLFSSKSKKILTKRNMIAAVLAYFVSAFGYYVAECILFEEGAVLLVVLGQELVQSLGSAIVFLVLGTALDKMGMKKRLD